MIRRRLSPGARGAPGSAPSSTGLWIVLGLVAVVAVLGLVVALGTQGQVNGTLSDEDFADEVARERAETWYVTFSKAGRKPTAAESQAFLERARQAARAEIAAEKARGARDEDLRRELRGKLAR